MLIPDLSLYRCYCTQNELQALIMQYYNIVGITKVWAWPTNLILSHDDVAVLY